MSGYEVAHVDEIPELDDGRCPMRPVRHHLGITGFGVTAWTARNAGDRILNEHDEAEPDAQEELYLVLRGHAVFELDAERRERGVRVGPSRRQALGSDDVHDVVLDVGDDQASVVRG